MAITKEKTNTRRNIRVNPRLAYYIKKTGVVIATGLINGSALAFIASMTKLSNAGPNSAIVLGLAGAITSGVTATLYYKPKVEDEAEAKNKSK